MKYLPIIGRLFPPVAMVVFLTREIIVSQGDLFGIWVYLVAVGAAFTAVGYEIVGILSGHALELASRNSDRARMSIAAVLLTVYTGIGVYIFWGQRALVLIPIVAAIVYLVSSLVEGLEDEAKRIEAVAASHDAFEEEEARKNAAFDRSERAKASEREAAESLKLKLAQAEHDAAVAIAEQATIAKVANAEARKAKAAAASATNSQHIASIEQHVISTEPAQSQHECEDCKKAFKTVQALNAHGRFCKGIPVNGNKEI